MLETGKYKLRKLAEADKYNLAKYANNREIWINLTDSFPYPYTLADAEKFIEYNKNTKEEFNLCIDFNGECIGMIGLFFKKGIRQKSPELGYWLAQPFWGQGIMSQCAPKFVEYVFANYDINRIQSSVYEWNKPSMRILEKTGFRLEAILKEAIFKDKKFTDEYIFRLFKSEHENPPSNESKSKHSNRCC